MIVGCGDLTILLVGLGFHCFLLKCKEKLRHSLGRPSRSDFVQVEFVNYPTLPSNKYYEIAKKYLPNGGCGVVSFELKGGREAAEKFMKNLKLAAIETHVADARTCCLNPATSTHRQMTDEQLITAGIPAGLIRISCGLEDKNDLIADISQALDAI